MPFEVSERVKDLAEKTGLPVSHILEAMFTDVLSAIGIAALCEDEELFKKASVQMAAVGRDMLAAGVIDQTRSDDTMLAILAISSDSIGPTKWIKWITENHNEERATEMMIEIARFMARKAT